LTSTEARLLLGVANMKMMAIVLALVSVALNAAAQLALKQGTRVVGVAASDVASGFTVLSRAAYSPWVWVGLGAYGLSVALWILVLSRVEVSYAYPMVSLGYVMATGAAWALWREDVSAMRMTGIGVICLGVALVARS
jgi:multidrug transporter EmrE-like cation transporter